LPIKKPLELTSGDEIALYIHWPFCLSRCPYCDFNAHVRPDIEQQDWGKALLSEMEYWAQNTPKRKIKSIFFGGGTPSLMKPSIAADIINKASKLRKRNRNHL
jgi:coproporphyrinogen III oxidase-like Fe-S oxidoreductase